MYRIKFAIFMLLYALSSALFAEETWLSEPPSNCLDSVNFQGGKLENRDVIELPKSRFSSAEYRLKDKPIIKLYEDLAKLFLNENYVKPQNKEPYLVRAVYGHGGTGNFYVYKCGDDLYIRHSSLGKSWVANRSAIIVNLDFQPQNIYLRVSIAE